MKSICLAIALGISLFQARSNEPNPAGEIVYEKTLTTNCQLAIVRLTRAYDPTNASQVVFGDVNYAERFRARTNLAFGVLSGVNYGTPDIVNTFVFYISTNGAQRVELCRTEVVGFKRGFFPSAGYVFMDCSLTETNLIVAYKYNLVVCCDVFDLATRQGLPRETTVVWRRSSPAEQVGTVSIITNRTNSGAIKLRVVPSGKPSEDYVLHNSSWTRIRSSD